MNPTKFRKKPVVIEAMLLDKDSQYDAIRWSGEGRSPISNAIIMPAHGGVAIITPEGTMFAPFGHWIIKGIANEFYACDPKIFAATYEPA